MTDKRHKKNPFLEYEEFTDISPVARKHLGFPGRMLYHSKSMAKPTTIFNANIFDRRAKKIWFGDIEIERDRKALLNTSEELGPLYITWEMDGRFLKFIPSKKHIEAKAIVTVADRGLTYSEEFAEMVEILTKRSKEPKEKRPIIIDVKSGDVKVGTGKDVMRYDIHRSPGRGRKGRDYVAITPDCIGGFAFGKTAENALSALKRLYTIRKAEERLRPQTLEKNTPNRPKRGAK